MLIPETMTRRTDDVTVLHWDEDSDGVDLFEYLEVELPDWDLHLVTSRTISATNPDGSGGFSVDRGDYLVKTSDDKIIRTSAETLSLFFS